MRQGRRRDRDLAGPRRAPPCDRRRRHRLCGVARRRLHAPRRQRYDRVEADRAAQLVSALRGRHPHLPAAARPRPAGGRRRSRARHRCRGVKHTWIFDIRAAAESDHHRHGADPGRPGLLQKGGLWARTTLGKPARRLSEFALCVRDLPECRAQGIRPREPLPPRRRSAISCRRRRPSRWMRERLA